MGIKRGFTLAEVLITLVIIGVIAAVTIPSLINKTNEQELVVAVKKNFSVISQAFEKIVAENGEINPSFLGESEHQATEKMGELFKNVLATQNICGMGTDGDCFPEDGYKLFDGRYWCDFNFDETFYKLRLNDGSSLAIFGYPNYMNWGTSESLKNTVGYVWVDVNGDKGPNTNGIDVYSYRITKYGIVPNGTPYETYSPLSSCRTTGSGCAAWVILKGNMKYLREDISW